MPDILSNPYRSNPTFYLGGGSGDIQDDAGIQWDYRTYGAGATMLRQGWTATNTHNTAYTNHINAAGNPWRVPAGQLGDCTLDYKVLRDGRTALHIQGTAIPTSIDNNFYIYWDSSGHNDGSAGSGQAVFPVDASNTITDAAIAGMYVKRVVGINQVGAATLDGTYFENVHFRDGNIGIALRKADGTLDASGPDTGDLTYLPQGWPLLAVDQSNTGYDADNWAYDGIGNKKWVVDYGFSGMRTPVHRGPDDTSDPTGTYRNDVIETRYPQETVSITLRGGAAHAVGSAARISP